ncbi:carbohydrate deacetylase [Vibrio sonorensis]|uniref:carbohydrate deacetylase n=1 Tax=Vibrio sonorensis TaxID=1004316 RepID=UPI0008DA063D|nr:carbohydrate deacetylase [Vibrio sonorensis]
MKLILNADDFGLTEAANFGIIDCMRAGTVKSTTIMMNQPGTKHAVELYHQGLVPEVGLHFTVTSGKPLSDSADVSSLVDDKGYFFDKDVLFNRDDVYIEHVEKEFYAQYNAAIEAGIDITHLDSHHFAGVYRPLKQAFINVSNELGLPVRRVDNILPGQTRLCVKTPDIFEEGFFAKGANIEHLKALLLSYKETHPNSTIEFMCHPANENTEGLKQLSSYNAKRVEEWQILTSPSFIDWLQTHDIECVGFKSL